MEKKRKSPLRILRIALAILTIIMLTAVFINLSGMTAFSFLAKAQFIPALLSANLLVLAIIIIGTLLFGRLYCSVLCPLGITQDLMNWLTKKLGGKKKAMRFGYSKPHNILRYTILGLYTLGVILGIGAFTALLDPYGAFGRIMTDIFQPTTLWLNNLCAGWWPENFVLQPYAAINSLSLSIAIVTFVIVAFLACIGGRTWCNNICPVGSLLGLLSKASVFKIKIDTDKCNNCGLCGKKCRASCIDTANHKIDASRCVDCFDCIDNCAHGAISYGPVKCNTVKCKSVNADAQVKADSAGKGSETPNDGVQDESRRKFLSVLALTGVAGTAAWAQDKAETVESAVTGTEPATDGTPITPFGSKSIEDFNDKCTACHLCVSKCPNKVLRPAVSEYGLTGIMQPVMDYTRGWCDYDCTICSEVCPTGAIAKLTADEKHAIRIGLAVYDRSKCVVEKDNLSCGHCADHCPASAIKLLPDYNKPLGPGRKRPAYPQVEPELCIGCGACQYHCPTGAIKVQSYPTHK